MATQRTATQRTATQTDEAMTSEAVGVAADKTETEVVETATAAKQKNETPKISYYDELVPVKLFRDDNRYKDDVFVAVNGKTMQIKRGEKVMIPRKFALVLENSEKQDSRASEVAHSMAAKEQVINMD